MKLDPDSEEFFQKFGFKLTTSMPHPIFKNEIIEFKGLEANYVSKLESDLEHYRKAYSEVLQTNQRLHTREHYRLEDEIKRLKNKDE